MAAPADSSLAGQPPMADHPAVCRGAGLVNERPRENITPWEVASRSESCKGSGEPDGQYFRLFPAFPSGWDQTLRATWCREVQPSFTSPGRSVFALT